MLLAFVFLIAGFVLLVKGADVFVEGSSNIAKFLKIPSIIIGLTIVAFGTSAPEAAVSIIAGVKGSNDIAVGNVIGSNMFNMLVVVGISAVIKPVNVTGQIIKKEFPFMLLVTAALIFMSYDIFFGNSSVNVISRSEAAVLLLFMAVFLYSVISSAMRSRQENIGNPEEEKPAYGLGKSILFTIGGLAGIVIGGQLVVDSAEKIALGFGMSETLVGLTIVAVGTSLPELVTSNVVGSNIFNILFVLAVSAAISPMGINAQCLIDMLIVSAVSVIAYAFCITGKRVNRAEGVTMVLIYGGYMAYAIVR